MGYRNWIKVHCDEWLSGDIRNESTDVRSVWIDLLCLAGGGRFGDTGEIKLSKDVGYQDNQIAGILSISLGTWMKAKERLVKIGEILVNTDNNIIIIPSWLQHQSEYRRQKPYRSISSQKLQDEVTTQSYTEKEREKENIEKEKENKEKETVSTSTTGISLSKILTTYKENIDINITPVLEEQLRQLAERYTGEWVLDAIEEAVKYDKKNLPYIEAILKRWGEQGKDSDGRRKTNPLWEDKPEKPLSKRDQLWMDVASNKSSNW